eukprot:5529428-Prymnesium_polylepis.1
MQGKGVRPEQKGSEERGRVARRAVRRRRSSKLVATERMGREGQAFAPRRREAGTLDVLCRACSRAMGKCCAFGGCASVGLGRAVGRIPRNVGRGSGEPDLGAAEARAASDLRMMYLSYCKKVVFFCSAG